MNDRRRQFLGLTLILGLAFVAPCAFADAHATPEDAKALADKAAAYLAEVGKDKAFAAFDNDPAWRDRDLFVYAYDFNGNCVANGGVKGLIGKNMLALTDPMTGDKILQTQIEIAKTKGEGWHEYHFSNPATKKIEQKKTYIKRVGDVYVGVGAYGAD
jgi:cytochrome c